MAALSPACGAYRGRPDFSHPLPAFILLVGY
jgi:hypothetical protein